MLGLVLVTESEETQRFITMLIVALLVFAGLLFLITLWYWRYTSPKRRVRRLVQPVGGGGPEVDLRRSPYPAADPRLAAQQAYGAQQGGYDPRRDPRSQAYDPRSVDGRGYDPRGVDGRGYDQRGYDQRGYDSRSVDGRGYDSRYASPAGADPYGRGEPRRRLLQDDEADPYGYGPARRQ